MFIEYEIKEENETYSSIMNVDHIVVIEISDIQLIIWMSLDTVRFSLNDDGNFILYDAFKRALCGESVIIDGIGYVRPLMPSRQPKEPSMLPITSMNWRNYA